MGRFPASDFPPAVEDATAMLYILSQPGPDLSLEEYNTWYDTDHGPLRASVPGVLSAKRYKLISSNPASAEWLAVYELNSPFVLKSKVYKEQWAAQPQSEKDLLAKCEILDRRVYTLYARRERADWRERLSDSEDVKKKRVFQTVALEPAKDAELDDDGFQEWYHEEHSDDMHRVPGWLRSTRWVLQEFGGANERDKGVDPPKFLAIHEYETEEFKNTKQYNDALTAPMGQKVRSQLGSNAELGFWHLWKEFK